MTASDSDLRQSIRELVQRRKAQLATAGRSFDGTGEAAAYRWNTRLKFGLGGSARPYLAGGWSLDEAGYVWTDGPAASLVFTADDPGGDVVIRLRARAVYPAERSSQPVRVRLNGTTVLRWTVAGRDGWHIGRMFEHVWRERRANELMIEPEFPISPRALGLGADDRQLGIAISELQLEVVR